MAVTKKNNVFLIIIPCLTLAWSNLCVVTGTICENSNWMSIWNMSFNGMEYLSVVGALCATDLVRHHHTGYSDKGRPEGWNTPTAYLQPYEKCPFPATSFWDYCIVLRGDGIPYSMANCKMQAPHRFRIPLQRRWRIKATFWTLYILWLYWAVDWLPVWLPPKASRLSSRMQAHTILLQMSSFKSRPQSHCDCLNIMSSPKRTKTICGSFWTPFQNVQYQRWLKS